MSNSELNILIADDHPLIRCGLKEILKSGCETCILYEASNGKDAFDLIIKHQPEIAIVDFDMPGLSGLEIARLIVKQKLPTAVVILTMYDTEEIFFESLESGVMGYVLKDGAMTEILDCINSVRAGEKYVTHSLAGLLIRSSIFSRRTEEEKAGLNLLTPAERKVLSLVARNKTTKEIAAILNISSRTVDRHRENICSKLKLSGNNALLHFALENKSRIELL
jgi:DNA-binding NarL/FixJ family response regulator